MKQLFFIVLLGSSHFVYSQTNLPYKVGEYASYKVSFGPIWVGYADLEITEIKKIENYTRMIFENGKWAIKK